MYEIQKTERDKTFSIGRFASYDAAAAKLDRIVKAARNRGDIVIPAPDNPTIVSPWNAWRSYRIC